MRFLKRQPIYASQTVGKGKTSMRNLNRDLRITQEDSMEILAILRRINGLVEPGFIYVAAKSPRGNKVRWSIEQYCQIVPL